MSSIYSPDLDLAVVMLLLGRLVFGLMFAAHGAHKLFGWFGGGGLDGTGRMFEQLGFHPGRNFAKAAGLTELTAGVLIALGLFGPLGPALLLSVMLVAVVTVHVGNGLLSTTKGVELPVLYATAAIIGALVGPGPLSLDELVGLPTVWPALAVWIVLILGVIGGGTTAALRHRTPSPRHA